MKPMALCNLLSGRFRILEHRIKVLEERLETNLSSTRKKGLGTVEKEKSGAVFSIYESLFGKTVDGDWNVNASEFVPVGIWQPCELSEESFCFALQPDDVLETVGPIETAVPLEEKSEPSLLIMQGKAARLIQRVWRGHFSRCWTLHPCSLGKRSALASLEDDGKEEEEEMLLEPDISQPSSEPYVFGKLEQAEEMKTLSIEIIRHTIGMRTAPIEVARGGKEQIYTKLEEVCKFLRIAATAIDLHFTLYEGLNNSVDELEDDDGEFPEGDDLLAMALPPSFCVTALKQALQLGIDKAAGKYD